MASSTPNVFNERDICRFSHKIEVIYESDELTYKASKDIRMYTQKIMLNLNLIARTFSLTKEDFLNRLTDVFHARFIDIQAFSNVLLFGKHLETGDIYLFNDIYHISTDYKKGSIYDARTLIGLRQENKAHTVALNYLVNHKQKGSRNIRFARYKQKVADLLEKNDTSLIIFNEPTDEELVFISEDIEEFRLNSRINLLFIHITPYPSVPNINLKIYKVVN